MNQWKKHSGRWRLGTLPLSILLTAVLAVGVAAAQSASVSGTVKDADGHPLPGVVIKMINMASGEETGATTDADGAYNVAGLPAGQYRFIASIGGYADYAVSVSLDDGESASEDLTLYPGALVEKVTVTAAKGERPVEELPVVVSVIGRDEIDDRRPESPQQAMEKVPNMRTFAQDPARQRPNLRGLQSSRVLVMVDGERLNNSRMTASSDGVSPSMIDVSQIESIEVVGGAASALWGSDAIGGTVNILTKAPIRPAEGTHQRAKLSLDYATASGNDREAFAYEIAQQKWAGRVSYSQFKTNPWKTGNRAINPNTIIPAANFALDVADYLDSLPGGGGEVDSFIQSYAVYNLPAGDDIFYGDGDGMNAQADFWFYPAEKHELRLRYLTSQHDDLQLAFRGPPTDRLFQSNKYRNYDKFSFGWDMVRVTPWLSRINAQVYTSKFEREAISDNYTIDQGSSWDTADPDGVPDSGDEFNFFTGDPSEHTLSYLQSTFMDIDQTGAFGNFHFEPWKNAILIAGLSYFDEENADSLVRRFPDGSLMFTSVTIPNTTYENTALFAQLEYKPAPWLKLTAGARRDKWETEARPTEGYAEGAVGDTLRFYLDNGAIEANPGELDVAGLAGLEQLGIGSISTENDVTTKNIGVTFLTPVGINPYVRWADSYREPDMSSRYLVRDFGFPGFVIAVIPNLALKPEEGENLDVGFKVKRRLWQAQLGYFKNELTNFLSFGQSGFYFDFAGVQPNAIFYQSINLSEAEISGWEGLFEAVTPLGTAGSLTTYVTLSTLTGENKNPSDADIAIIDEFYGRDDTPIEFKGSVSDVPLGGIIPFQANATFRFTPLDDKWFLEWELRHVDTIDRVDPSIFTDFEAGQYGPMQSLFGFTKHTVRAGFDLPTKQNFPLRGVVAIDNLFDDLYFDPFQLAPATGRSIRLGITARWDSLGRE